MSEFADNLVRFNSAEWGAVALERSDVELLASSAGTSMENVVSRLQEYRPSTFAAAWREVNPVSDREIRDFYATTPEYLWELLVWNHSDAYEPYRQRVATLAQRWPPSGKRALDYGSGVGTAAIALARAGYRTTLADIPGATLDFAQERMRARGLDFDVIEVHDQVPRLPRAEFDVVVCFDVFEHLTDPGGVARALVRSIGQGGGATIVASFDETGVDRPEHLPDATRRFGSHRWDYLLEGLGMRRLPNRVYEKQRPVRRCIERGRYELWARTGLRLQRVPR